MATKKKTPSPTTKTATERVRTRTSAPGKGLEGKGSGVIQSIAEFLCSATKAKPLSKDDLLAKLVKRFPEREAEKLRVTLNCQLGARIERERGIKITKDDEGR